jgi:ABC-type multidrug transport system permease subunit
MRFALIAALKDLRRRMADPAALLIWLGMPVLLGTLMSLIGGGNGAPPKARLLLVDLDQTFVSRLVGMAGGASQLAQFLEIETVTEDVGRRRIDDGDANALLILPKGFQDGVLREQPAELTLLKNPSQRIMPGVIEEGLQMVVEAAFYAQRLFGEPIRQIADSVAGSAGPSDAAVAAVSQAINQRLQKLQSTLAPPVLTLDAGTRAAAAESFDVGAMFLPGLLFMAVMFTAQGMSYDIWVEKTGGTLRRTLSAPQGAAAFLAGKLAAGVAVMMAATVCAVALGVVAFDVPVARAPLALIWTAYTGAAILCLLIAVQLVSTSARGAQLLSTLIVFPLIMIGGSFFPFEAMPPWMADIGRWTPNGLAVVETKRLLFGAVDPAALALAALGIGLPAVVVFFLSVRRLKRAFATS